MNNVYKILLSVFVILLIGCTSEVDIQRNELELMSAKAAIDVDNLKTNLASGLIKNATVLKLYADMLAKQKPELAKLAEVMSSDATPKGPIYRSLENRVNKLKSQPTGDLKLSQIQALQKEARNISVAADSRLFGLMLTDPINVLADMSDGRLARVEAMSKEASAQVNKSTDYGAGSQLIGNPNYGSWQQQSNGTSIWTWIGAYALMSSFNRGPAYYGAWGANRGYSYYNDYGRSSYTSPAQRKTQNVVEQRTKKQFNKSGKTFNSPYANKRTGSRTVASKSAAATQRARSNSFKSSYGKSSSSSSYGSKYASSNNSSSRSSSYSRTSRRSGGK